MIYLSSRLPILLPKLALELENKLKVVGESISYLQNTNDIWARDYMPVKVGEEYIQFIYDPSYLKDKPELKTDPEQCRPSFLKVKPSGIKIDGGNVVINKRYVILTDAVESENQNLSKRELYAELKTIFPNQKVVIVPHEPDDILKHSDGMLRLIGEKKLIVNDCVTNDWSSSFRKKFMKSLEKLELDPILCPYYPSNEKAEDGTYYATGNYINYLETDRHLFLPQFNTHERDTKALEFFSAVQSKKVVPVDCEELAKGGGLLNCISWEG